MFDQIAAATLGAAGFFMPDINRVRHDAPYDGEVDRDMKMGAVGALGFSFLIAFFLARRDGEKAIVYWLVIVGLLAGAYWYAYRTES